MINIYLKKKTQLNACLTHTRTHVDLFPNTEEEKKKLK